MKRSRLTPVCLPPFQTDADQPRGAKPRPSVRTALGVSPLVPPREYRRRHPDTFGSMVELNRYVERHQRRLASAGAIRFLNGACWISVDTFDALLAEQQAKARPSVRTADGVLTLMQPREYRRRRTEVFGSILQLNRHVSRHRRRLAAAGAIFFIDDVLWIEPRQFDALLVEYGYALTQDDSGASQQQ